MLRIQPILVNKLERYGALIVGFLILFRIVFGTDLDFFLLNSLTILAVFYLWFGFFIFTRAIPSDILDRQKRAAFTPFRIASSILMGVVYSVCLISVLYSLFFYPRMQFMLGFSLFLLATSGSLIGVYVWLNRQEWGFIKQFFLRSVILGSVVLIMFSVPLEKRLQILFRKHPTFIEAYLEYREDPGSETALERLREERSRFR